MLYRIPQQERIWGILTSKQELYDLLKAWVVITLAFTIVMIPDFTFSQATLLTLFISAVTVGTGFLLHELAHKFVAQYYHCWAEFRAYDLMLLIALFSSFFGFLFAAPGAVMIDARGITRKQHGLVALAGPATNFVLAAVFAGLLAFISLGTFWQLLFQYGASINVWLGVFNLIPFGPFDGKKIFAWSKFAWGISLFFGIVLYKVVM